MSKLIPDSEAEKLLRQIIDIYILPSGMPLIEYVKQLDKAVNQGRWYLERKDACQFVTETGLTCSITAVRVSHSILCCEKHAKIRDASLG